MERDDSEEMGVLLPHRTQRLKSVEEKRSRRRSWCCSEDAEALCCVWALAPLFV